MKHSESAYAAYYRACAEARRAEARAARISPFDSVAKREERGKLYDKLAADYDQLAAEVSGTDQREVA